MTHDPVPQPAAITPAELDARLRTGDAPQLVDVREPFEHAIARLPTARLVPLASLAARLDELDPARETVVLCHHGIRSAAAAEFLRSRGFARVLNLTGGIDRWSLEVDPRVARY